MTTLTYINVEKLKLHPQNMRLYYPPEDVAEMAKSIQSVGGVLQALLVVADPESNGSGPRFLVVDGNMRLAAARTIPDCPPLKCEIISSNRAEQLLVMTATSHHHYPKDPISQARHYRRLIDQEGLTPTDIAQAVGVNPGTIYNRLFLLELDDDIQSLLIERRLSLDVNVLRYLMKIPEQTTRIHLARRAAINQTSARQFRRSITHVLNQYQQMENKPDPKPFVQRKPRSVQAAGQLDAAAIQSIAAQTLCDDCRLHGLTKKCWVCPGPYDFVNALVEKAEFQLKKETANV